ncbi:MAG: hypothetical protein GX442_24295 [Candidatus Riflebacteria bacterium]|nr:hypothetical protein [Candidatus Riflebacteria bacterium]
MGIFDRLTGFKNLLWKITGREFWALLGKPPRGARQRPARLEVRFVLLQAADETPEAIESRLGSLLALANRLGATVEAVFSSLVFLTLPSDAPPEAGRDLCQALLEACQGQVRALYGTLPAHHGRLGGFDRRPTSTLVAHLHHPLTRLLSLGFGSFEEWGPRSPDPTPPAEGGSPATEPAASSLASTLPGATPPPHPEATGRHTVGEWYVVWDAIGDGQLVGIFEDRRVADALVRVNPWYYKVIPTPANLARRSAVEWLDAPQQQAIGQIAGLTPK